MMNRRTVASLVLLGFGGAAGAAPARPDPLPAALEAHVRFLADDALEGRGLGSRGHAVAVNYIVAEFAKLGLRPAGSDGWFQSVRFAESRFSSTGETMTLARDGAPPAVWRNGTELSLAPGEGEGAETITAPLAFVGFGLKDSRLGLDDYAGIDVAGRIVVALVGAPPAIDSETAAHLGRGKVAAALAAGAIGVIQVRTLADAARLPWEKAVARARLPRRAVLTAAGLPLGDGAGLKVRATVDDGAAAVLFAGAPRSFEAIRAAAAAGPVRGFALAGTVTVARAQTVTRISSPNVLGLLPGSSPALAAEVVLLSAHSDHVGMKPEGSPGDRIFNGALDNASGVAILIETARALATAPKGPKRSILFAAWTAEESGLLGAAAFAATPTLPLARVVATVNLDMPIVTCAFADIVPFGANRSTLGPLVAAAARAEGLTVSPDPQPAEAIFTRSDHYMLVREGVPAVFLKTGWKDSAGGTSCGVAERYFRLSRYHEVSDDMTLPFDWAAAARFTRLNTGIARRIADAREAPRWYAGDYFGESFGGGRMKAAK